MSRETNLALVQRLHRGDRPMRELLLEVAADDIEWWVPGDRAVLPWAGIWHGKDGLRRQTELLRAALEYTEFGVLQYIADGDEVVLIARSAGRARATGRAFRGEHARVFTVRDGKVVRVRTYSDTARYVVALGGP